MKGIILNTVLAMVTVLVNGCVFKVPSTAPSATNIYSFYDDKIASKVVLVLDENLRDIQQPVNLKSDSCSGHSYAVSLKNSLATSIQETTQLIFAEVVERPVLPPKGIIKKLGCAGTVYVKLSNLDATLDFCAPIWKESSTKASSALELLIKVQDPDGVVLLDTSVHAARAVDGRWRFCFNGHHLLSNAILQTIREAMEIYAEKLTNSRKIRKSFSGYYP